MTAHTYINTEFTDGVLVATVLDPTVSDYEADAIYHDVTSHAAEARWRVVLDVSRIELLTSAGIGMLIRLLKACREKHGRFVIAGLSKEIHGLLKTTRVDRLFDFQPTVEKGVKRAAR